MRIVPWVGVGLAFVTGPAAAATHSWTGNGATLNWSDPGNWSGGVPVNDPAGLHLVFGDDASGTHAMVQDIVGLQIASMSFDAFGGDGYVLDGIGFEVAGEVGVFGETHEIRVPVVLGGELFVSAGFPFGGVRFLGPITGPHGISNGGFLTLGGDNDFTGPVVLENGAELTVRHAHALGTARAGTSGLGTLRFEDYVYDPARIETIELTADPVASIPAVVEGAGTSVVENLFLGPTAFAAAINLDPGSRLDLLRLTSVPQVIEVNAPDATLRLPGPIEFDGLFMVGEGTLVVNGTGPTAHFGLSSLPPTMPPLMTGAGTIGGLLLGNADVSPGDPEGTLTIQGDLLFLGDSRLHIRLSPGPTSNRIVATGLVDLGNATLDVTRSFLPPIGTVFTFLTHGGNQVGQFAGLPNGAELLVMGQTYRIDYLPTAVTLTALDDLPVTLESFRIE